jgi:hypothetical protein
MTTAHARSHAEHDEQVRQLTAKLPEELRHAVVPAAELVRAHRGRLREEPLITSVSALDQLLGGGLPRGTLVELVGRASCGRLSALLATLKTVTDTGEAAALVDQGGQLDPRSALSFGIDLERLLWLRPRALSDTVAAAELLVSTGFPLVAVDLGLPPVRGRAPLASWLRLARGSLTHRAVVLVGSPYRLSGCAAAAVVTAGRGRGRWSGSYGTPRLLCGLAARLEVARQRGRRPHRSAPIAFTLPEAGFQNPVPVPVSVSVPVPVSVPVSENTQSSKRRLHHQASGSSTEDLPTTPEEVRRVQTL